MDHKKSDLLERFFTDKDITVEDVPPGDHTGLILLKGKYVPVKIT
jgi:hypothetical protein